MALIALGGAAFLPPAFAHDDASTPAAATEAAKDLDRRWGEDDQEYARRLFERGHIVSLESIVQQAQTIRSGELLEVELERKHGRHIYEVEILDATGQAWELKFDARDGRLLKEEMEDH